MISLQTNNNLPDTQPIKFPFFCALDFIFHFILFFHIRFIPHFHLCFNSNNKSPSSSLSPNDVGGMNGINSVLSNNIGLSAFTTMLPNLDDRSKKSQNMTECVPVPSSEHVAEIVGRQGNSISFLLTTILWRFFLSLLLYCCFAPWFCVLLMVNYHHECVSTV